MAASLTALLRERHGPPHSPVLGHASRERHEAAAAAEMQRQLWENINAIGRPIEHRSHEVPTPWHAFARSARAARLHPGPSRAARRPEAGSRKVKGDASSALKWGEWAESCRAHPAKTLFAFYMRRATAWIFMSLLERKRRTILPPIGASFFQDPTEKNEHTGVLPFLSKWVHLPVSTWHWWQLADIHAPNADNSRKPLMGPYFVSKESSRSYLPA
jgi:hypothetical protein